MPPACAKTFSTSQMSPKSTMRPLRLGVMSVVKILTEGWPACDRLGQLRHQFGRELALHHRVKGIVAMAVAGPFLLPPLDRLLHIVAVADQRKVDDRRRAAVQCRLADPRRPVGHLVLGGAGHDDRPAAMDMRVDPARE